MRKMLSLFGLVIGLSIAAQAQYFTLRVAGGYAWPGFLKAETIKGPRVDPSNPYTDALVDMSNIYHPNDSIYNVELVKGSYGQGANFTFGFGYMVNPYFGVELGVSYLKSANITSHQTYELIYDAGGGFFAHSPYQLKVDMSTHAFGLSLSPAIVVQAAKPGWKVYPYGRLGISLPVFGELTHNMKIHIDDEVFTQAPNIAKILDTVPYFLGNNTDVTLKTEGTVSLGINGAIGVKYEPLPYLSVFAEVNGQYLVTRAKSSKITKWNVDGEDKLGERGVYRTQFNFVDKIDESSNNGDYNKTSNGNPKYDATKPKDDLRPTGPFNNLGINVGVTFMLSKQIFAKGKKKG